MGKGKCVQNGRRRDVTCLSLSAEHSTFPRWLHAIGCSVGRENDTIMLERLGIRETVNLRRCEEKLLSNTTVQVTRKGEKWSYHPIAIGFRER